MTCDSFLGCIAEPARHAILEALAEGPLHVGPLAEQVGLEQSNVSHHLRLLRGCGFVQYTRDGKANLYALAHPQIAVLLATIRDTRDVLSDRRAGPAAGTARRADPKHSAPPPTLTSRRVGTPRRRTTTTPANTVDA